MYVERAHYLLARRKDRSNFDVGTSLSGRDAWPLVAAAAAFLSGQLDDCLDDDDLDDALAGFLAMYRLGLVSRERLEAEIARLLLKLTDCEAIEFDCRPTGAELAAF